MATATRKRVRQVTLEVQGVQWLTPAMVRIVLGGEEFDAFEDNGCSDRYVKMYFADPRLGLEPPFDLKTLRETLAPEDIPVTRTYTVRWIDPERRQLALDFVVHGDSGLAGPWAAQATPGDRVVLGGPGGKYLPSTEADWHLFAGDESAAPAIAASVETLPADARGLVYLEVEDAEHAPPIHAPEHVRVQWVCRDGAGDDPSRLVDAIRAGDWPEGDVEVFAHGERESMKGVRALLKERRIDRSRISLSGYWAYGRTEDRFQAEKREPIGKIPD